MKKTTTFSLLTAPSLAFAHTANELHVHDDAAIGVVVLALVGLTAYIVAHQVVKFVQKRSSSKIKG